MSDIHYNPAGNRPLIIMLHGGGGTHGKPDADNIIPLENWGTFADIVSLDYPLASTGNPTFPGILWWLAKRFSDLIDEYQPPVTCVMGLSMGANMGLNAIQRFHGDPAPIRHPECFVGLYGPYDLLKRSEFHPEANRRFNIYLTGSEDDAPNHVRKRASPYYGGWFPPMLLVHGTRDGTVNWEQSQRLAVTSGADLISTDQDHGFNPFGVEEQIKEFICSI